MIFLQSKVYDTRIGGGETHPLAGTNRGAAIATLTYGLKHLPDLAANFADHPKLMEGAVERWMLRL
jgi:hypothetical protein